MQKILEECGKVAEKCGKYQYVTIITILLFTSVLRDGGPTSIVMVPLPTFLGIVKRKRIKKTSKLEA